MRCELINCSYQGGEGNTEKTRGIKRRKEERKSKERGRIWERTNCYVCY